MPSILQSKLTTLALLIGLAWIGLAALSINERQSVVRQEEANAEARVAALERDLVKLEEDIARAHNPAFLERQAKVVLNYRRADERVAFIYRAPSPSPASHSLSEPVEDEGRFRKWLRGLFEE